MSELPLNAWVIEFRNPKMDEPLQVRVEQRVVVGRYDVNQTKQPDVDLAPYAAEEQGVSRQHLAIFPEGDQLMIADLNSGNGTFLNNVRVEPNKPTRLKHDDLLKLGNLELDVRVIIAPAYSGSFQKQSSLQMSEKIHTGSGQLILIVEDHPEVAKLMALIMERAGYTTAVSHDVVTAIRIFNQRHPVAIILDLMLPDMHGLEFCRYVRRDVRYNSTPIIIVSAAKTPENVNNAMQSGADIFLAKPLSAKELSHVVTSLVNQRESGQASLHTKHLVGTAPLQAMAPETRHDTAVLFIAGHTESPITVTLKQPVTLGRSASTPGKPHIDLTRFGAVDLGVSRLHSVLHHRGGKFYVEDNGSSNGTFVNGEPVKEHELRELHNADEVRLGQLRMYVYFLTDSEKM